MARDQSEVPLNSPFKFNTYFIVISVLTTISIYSDEGIFFPIKEPSVNMRTPPFHLFIIMIVIALPLSFAHNIIGHVTHSTCASLRKMMPLSTGLPISIMTISLLTVFYDILCLRISVIYTIDIIIWNGDNLISCGESSRSCQRAIDIKDARVEPPNNGYFELSPFVFLEGFYTSTHYILLVLSLRGLNVEQKTVAVVNLIVTLALPVILYILARLSIKKLFSMARFALKAYYICLVLITLRLRELNGFERGLELLTSRVFDSESLLSPEVWFLAFVEVMKRFSPFLVSSFHLAAYVSTKSNIEYLTIELFMFYLLIEIKKSLISLSVTGLISKNLAIEPANFKVQNISLTFGLYPSAISQISVGEIVYMGYFYLSLSIVLASKAALLIRMTNTCLHEVISKAKSFENYFVSSTSLVFTLLLVTPDEIFTKTALQIGFNDAFLIAIPIVAFWDTLCIFYFYGVIRLSDDFHFKSGHQPNIYYKSVWIFLPLITLMSMSWMMFGNLKIHELLAYGSIRNYYMFFVIPVVMMIGPVIVGLLYNMLRYITARSLLTMFAPLPEWGDPREEERLARVKYPPRTECRFRRRVDTCNHRCLRYSKVLPVITKREYHTRMAMEKVAFEVLNPYEVQ